MGRKSRSVSGMNNLDHISESVEQFFRLKYLNSLMRMRIRIRDPGIFLTLDPGWKKFGSLINIPDPQHWLDNKRRRFLFVKIAVHMKVKFLKCVPR
jgi:hypothetical protein